MMNSIVVLITLVASWMVFRKMGRQGWEAIIPGYNAFVLFEEVEGSGFKFFYLFIPFVNIYWIFKICIDLAHCFNKQTSFGIGLVFFPPIFICLLAFSDALYLNGIYENKEEDFLTDLTNKVTKGSMNLNKDDKALEKLEKLEEMYRSGIVTEEEFDLTKKELLKRI